MSAHVLLHLLNELGKVIKSRLAKHFMTFSQLVKQIQYYRNTNVRFYVSYGV